MTIQEHWISFLYRAATGTRKTRILLTPVGAMIFGVFSALFVLAGILVDTVLGLPDLLPQSAILPLSVLTIGLGILAVTWSVFHFHKVKGTPVPFNPPPQLVRSGPYQYSRNPMLTGVFLILFGIGFGVNSISLVLVFTPLYIVANVWELKHIEEPELARRLGDEYIEYRRTTPMFVPALRH